MFPINSFGVIISAATCGSSIDCISPVGGIFAGVSTSISLPDLNSTLYLTFGVVVTRAKSNSRSSRS